MPAEINTKLVPKVWHRAVLCSSDLPQGAVDRDAYVVCVLEQLLKALRVRDVYANPSHRYGDPRARLLSGDSWAAVRPEVLEGLGLGVPVHQHLREQVLILDAGWMQMSARLTEAGEDSIVKIVPVSDTSARMRLSVEHLDALDIPAPLIELRALTAGMLPRIDLPELLLEVHAWTGGLNSYVPRFRREHKDAGPALVGRCVVDR